MAIRKKADVQLELAVRLGFCRATDVKPLQARVDAIGRMWNGLIESLEQAELQRDQ